MSDQVEEIKNKVDIVELIQGYLPLKKAGRNFKGLCPFHGEKTPSMMVNPELQIFKCFGCGVGGDVYVFLQKMEGIEFGEALLILAKKTGITLDSYKPTKGEEDKDRLIKINNLTRDYYHFLLTKHRLGEEALKYLIGRGITLESIEKFNLGFAPDGWDNLIKYLCGKKNYKLEDLHRAGLAVEGKNYDRFRNRVMFPLANHRGQVVGFAGRVMPAASAEALASQGGKYVNTPETEIYHKSDLLYAMDIHKTEIKTLGWVVVVEGEIDSIAADQAGTKNVVAIKGSAFTQRQVEFLRRYVDIVVLGLDADLAGDMAARRGIEIAVKAGLIVKVIEPSEKFKDPGDWATLDPQGWQVAVEKAIPIYDFYIESAVKRLGLDATGKTKIGREIVPIISQMDDEIMKGHYIKKLATVIGVEEEDVRKQVSKTKVEPSFAKAAEGPARQRPLREVVEEYVVELAIKEKKIEYLTREPISGWIKSEFWKRVVGELASGKSVAELSAELRPRVEELFLTENEDEAGEWDKVIKRLEEVNIREEIVKNIDQKEVALLSRRLAILTKDK